MKKSVLLIFTVPLFLNVLFAQHFIVDKKEAGSFPVVSAGAASIYVAAEDHWLVHRPAALLQQDIRQVSGKLPITWLPRAGMC